MAKQTVLELVQGILNDLDGDEVNSIDDTIESEQIARILKDTFDAMISNREWLHTKQLLTFNNPASTATPTHLTYNEDIKKIISINYNKAENGETRLKYLPIKWKYPDDFLRLTNQRNNDDSNIDIVTDPSGIQLLIRNDLHPTYYTTFDEETIVFDSYDKDVDDTIISSKIQSMGYVIPSFTISDDHIPDLPSEAFTYLLEEAKSRAAIKLRQVQDPKAEQESIKQNRWLSRKQWTVYDQNLRYPDYGRRSRK